MPNFHRRMISFYIRFIVITLMAPAIFAFLIQLQRLDFSGTWSLNIQQSEFAEAPVYTASKQLKVDQNPDSMIIERLVTNAKNEDHTSTEILFFKNRESVSTTSDHRKKTSSVSWSPDGQVFTENSSYSFLNIENKAEYSAVEIWQLTNSNNVLTVSRTVTYAPGKTYAVKAVYDRK